MPEIDSDVYNLVSLALLGLLVLLTLAVLIALGRIRRVLDHRLSETNRALEVATRSLGERHAAVPTGGPGPEPEADEPASPAGALETEPALAGAGAIDSTALSSELSADETAEDDAGPDPAPDPVAEDALDAEPEIEIEPEPEPEQVEAEVEPEPSEPDAEAASEAEPEPRPDPDPEPELETGVDSTTSDEPFEQGGRWYFRRSGELLVYDEGTGEWVEAPPGALDGDDSWSEAGSLGTGDSGPAAEADDDAGSFWKCSSCGAVNGSTAPSCRMCFAPRS